MGLFNNKPQPLFDDVASAAAIMMRAEINKAAKAKLLDAGKLAAAGKAKEADEAVTEYRVLHYMAINIPLDMVAEGL